MEFKKERYIAVDIIKIIFAYAIVLQHVLLFNSNNDLISEIIAYTASIAVSYFFMASGFFLYKKILSSPKKDKYIIKQYTKGIAIMYVIWTIILFIFRIPAIIRIGANVELQGQYWFGYIRSVLFVGEYQLWYLLGLIQILIVFFLMHRNKYLITCLGLSIITYITKLIVTYNFGIIESNNIAMSIYKCYENIFVGVKNGIFSGFIFFMIGCCIANATNIIRNKVSIGILTIISIILGFYIRLQGREIAGEGLKTIAVVLLFYLTILIGKKMYGEWIRNISSFVYVSHIAILLALEQIIGKASTLVEWILCCTIATVGGSVLFILAKKVKWMKYLY